MASINKAWVLQSAYIIVMLLVVVGFMILIIYASSRTYSVPSPVFEPERTVAQGWQSWLSEPDAITGIVSHTIATRGVMVGEDTRNSDHYDHPTLILRCENDEFDIIIHWGGRFIADSMSRFLKREIPTILRFDDQFPVAASSAESTDNESMFLKRPNRFIAQLGNAEQMTVRMTNYNGDQRTAQFAVAGLVEHWANLPCVR